VKKKNKTGLKIRRIKNKGCWGIAFLLLFITPHLTPPSVKNLERQIEITPQEKSQGNILAFRLKTSSITLSLCTQGHCYRGKTSWQLVPEPMNYYGDAGLLITNQSQGWTLRDYEVTGIIFDRSQRHLTHLRLPAQVVKQLEESEDAIEVDTARNLDLYKIKSERPFSTHWRLPIVSPVTSKFGSPRLPPDGTAYAHTGLDFRAPTGTQVRACSDGIVLDQSLDPISGNVVTIDHGHGLLSRYMHLSAFKVQVGDEVKGGQLIGLSGTTGRSEAPHLHWEMRLYGNPIDPLVTMHLMERLADLE
jgi:hypothetical protein